MTLNEKINHLRDQLELAHSQSSTESILVDALALLRKAKSLWTIPGKQNTAISLEEEAMRVLRSLNQGLKKLTPEAS